MSRRKTKRDLLGASGKDEKVPFKTSRERNPIKIDVSELVGLNRSVGITAMHSNFYHQASWASRFTPISTLGFAMLCSFKQMEYEEKYEIKLKL